MRQIVTGLFETYDDARRAQDALLLKGFAANNIELPVPGTDGVPGDGDAQGGHGLLAGLERFVSSLFASRPATEVPPASPHDEARDASMQFALQRGAVLLGVQVFDDTHAAVARDTLIQQQALEVNEHAADWRPGAADPDALREHSALDELGIGGVTGATRRTAGREPVDNVPDDSTLQARYDAMSDAAAGVEPATRPADDPAVTALTPGMTPDSATDREPVVLGGEATVSPQTSVPLSPVPDEFLEYEEDFRGHHATRYVDEGAPFERYQDAYR
ncbi:MAG TPA: hypothetical protein VGG24_01610, partial [Paraburkholderia sp.]